MGVRDKSHVLALAGWALAAAAFASESAGKDDGFRPPAGWRTVAPGLYARPSASGAGWRLAQAASDDNPAVLGQRLREDWQRMLAVETCEEREVPLGGRAWQRVRIVSILAGQRSVCTAWIGRIGRQTWVFALTHSAEESDGALQAQLEASIAMSCAAGAVPP